MVRVILADTKRMIKMFYTYFENVPVLVRVKSLGICPQ